MVEQQKLNWEVFEQTGTTDEFLKMKDGDSLEVTFDKVEIISVPVEDQNGNQLTNPDGSVKQKPQLKFTIDTINGQRSKKVWNTGNRNIVNNVKLLVERGMLTSWVFILSKSPPTGKSKFSSYVLAQLSMKPVKADQAKTDPKA